MSKRRTNRKLDQRKVRNRSRYNTGKVTNQVDMPSPKADEMQDEQELTEDIVSDTPSGEQAESVPLEKEKGGKRELRPLSDEMQRMAIGAIREQWPKMKSKQDLLRMLNAALVILYGEGANKLTIRTLNYYAYSTNNKSRYITFQIPKKKKGEFRTIDAPCASLKMIQRALNVLFQILYTPHQAAMGFVPHRSVVTNAKMHVGQRFVYNLDLKDFFPSISSGRLYKRLLVTPFNMKEDLASIVTDLCCYKNSEGKNVLPQGAPTSPTITNFIGEHLDRKLTKLAKAYGMKYSRYADDITFSCMKNMFAEDGKFCKSLKHIIEDEEHFKINPDKTRLCTQDERQEVTGLTVNVQTNVSQKYIKSLRTIIHLCEIKGLPKAQQIFEKIYTPKTLRSGAIIPRVEKVIAGKLLYLKMVVGEDNDMYKRLISRLNILVESTQKSEIIEMNQKELDTSSNSMGNISLKERDILKEFIALNELLE